MTVLLRFNGASKRDPLIQEWLNRTDSFTAEAREWFKKIRACGDDVAELLHDGYPTACVQGVPFAYVSVFKDHTNVGFFYGAQLADPAHLLEGSGRFMRHVKIRPGQEPDSSALLRLIETAYEDVRLRLRAEQGP
jgi:hypothetical protein